jgi:uncharacterized membrane protein
MVVDEVVTVVIVVLLAQRVMLPETQHQAMQMVVRPEWAGVAVAVALVVLMAEEEMGPLVQIHQTLLLAV